MLPFARGVEVLKVDANGLLALFKPAGILAHPNPQEWNKTVIPSLIRAPYCFENESYRIKANPNDTEETPLWLLHRLDSATSGVILASTNKEVAEAVKLELKRRNVVKHYTALVFNNFISSNKSSNQNIIRKPFHWRDDMFVEKKEGMLRALSLSRSQGNGYVTAESIAQIMSYQKYPYWEKEKPNYSLMLMDLQPLTGYTHQLRYQSAQHNYPIVGDRTYGDFKANKQFKAHMNTHPFNYCDEVSLIEENLDYINIKNKAIEKKKLPNRNHFNRLFLHARKIELSYTLNGKKYDFTAEASIPKTFDAAMKGKI